MFRIMFCEMMIIEEVCFVFLYCSDWCGGGKVMILGK